MENKLVKQKLSHWSYAVWVDPQKKVFGIIGTGSHL